MTKNIVCAIAALFIVSCTFNYEDNFKILTFKKVTDVENAQYNVCDNLLLTKTEIALYFDIAEQVSNEKGHGESLIMPCKYSGKLITDHKTYSYDIFAGGSGYIYNNKGWVVKSFICKDKSCCNKFSNLC